MAKNPTKKGAIPPIVYAEVSVHSMCGVSLFETSKLVTSNTVSEFYSDYRLINETIKKLCNEGFEVLNVSPTTITIAAPAKTYEEVFKTTIVAEEREVIKDLGRVDTATILDSPDTDISGLIDPSKSSLADVVEGVALNEPVYYFGPSPFPPLKEYWHLVVPAGVSLGMNAPLAHRAGFTGAGVSVVMVDSGWYNHPFFIKHGYRANVVLGPVATNPDHDEHGHGTGESANIFSVAPDVAFSMVKINFVNSIGAFNTAVSLNPDIISCSWGSSKKYPPLSAADQALAAAVANAVKKGIIVIFSSGNGHWGFPGQHPDVISAGGVCMNVDSSLEATPYASGFESKIYTGRNVPDVCGLVGLPPRALYIMLPVEPKNYLDKTLSGDTHPNGDETAPDDGWAAFSGTSAAAPQLAGICALMKQACPYLTPEQVRGILKKTARDITAGCCNVSTGGHPAKPGPDLATGHGLADAFRAVVLARLRPIMIPVHPGPRPFGPSPSQPLSTLEKEIEAVEDLALKSME